MGSEIAKEIVVKAGYRINYEMRLPNDKGSQMRLATGQVVCIYDTGKVVIQGRNPAPVAALFLGTQKATFKRDPSNPGANKSTDIFAVSRS